MLSINNQSMLDSALSYANKGFYILPVHTAVGNVCSCGVMDCSSPGKHPRIHKWPSTATSELEVIRIRWTKWPESNIGILTGAKSRIFVIDVDGKAGEVTFQSLVTKHGPLPETLVSMTGRGKHYYFKHPGHTVKTQAGQLGEGLDVRGDGGYVVAPPSRHASGVVYEWVNPDVPIAEPPAWLIEMVCDSPKPVPDCEEIMWSEDDPIPQGTRNDSMFKIASSLRGRGFEPEVIEEVIAKTNETKCIPPLPAVDIHNIAKSVAKYPPGSAKRKENPLWWFKFDVNEWCKDTNVYLMTDYQVGWYTWLIVECWKQEGRLPADLQVLAKLARAKSLKKFRNEYATVLHCFEPTEDGAQLVHPKLRELWEEKVALVEQNRRAGKIGADSNQKGKAA